MSYFIILVITTYCYATQIPFDVAYCIETKECGITSIGSFSIKDSTNISSIDGYLYEIKNGLLYDAYFYWDTVIGGSGMVPTQSMFNDTNDGSDKKSIFIPAGNIRYFDSGIHTTHVVRMLIKMTDKLTSTTSYEAIDMAVGQIDRKVSDGKKQETCDYLFRICYLNQKYGSSGEDKCAIYDKACNAFYKKSQDDICLDTCITSYYSHLLNDEEKIAPNFNRLTMVQCIIDSQRRINSGTMSTDSAGFVIAKNSAAYIQRLETTVTILSVLLVILVVFVIICLFVWARNRYMENKYGRPVQVHSEITTNKSLF